jgi:transcription termination factor NusB
MIKIFENDLKFLDNTDENEPITGLLRKLKAGSLKVKIEATREMNMNADLMMRYFQINDDCLKIFEDHIDNKVQEKDNYFDALQRDYEDSLEKAEDYFKSMTSLINSQRERLIDQIENSYEMITHQRLQCLKDIPLKRLEENSIK